MCSDVDLDENLNFEHYSFLVECSKNNDASKWNEFLENYDGVIQLQYADFSNLEFNDFCFSSGATKGVNFYGANFYGSKLNYVDFRYGHLIEANFENTKILSCSFIEANLNKSNFKNSDATLSNFNFVKFDEANLRNTNFFQSNFYESSFIMANLEDTHFVGGGYNPLYGKKLRLNLCGAIFKGAKFNSGTYFDNYYVSTQTDFRTINFESANYSSGLRQTLRYCNRRHNWDEWYSEQNNKLVIFFVRKFWQYSDYGISVVSLVKSFCKIASFFAILYFLFPSLIHGLEPLQPLRAFYFSIVTMTTLGYGDMYPVSGIGQLLVMLQVIYGYVLLGSLLTILSNHFTSDGPAVGLIEHPSNQEDFKINVKIKIRDME